MPIFFWVSGFNWINKTCFTLIPLSQSCEITFTIIYPWKCEKPCLSLHCIQQSASALALSTSHSIHTLYYLRATTQPLHNSLVDPCDKEWRSFELANNSLTQPYSFILFTIYNSASCLGFFQSTWTLNMVSKQSKSVSQTLKRASELLKKKRRNKLSEETWHLV